MPRNAVVIKLSASECAPTGSTNASAVAGDQRKRGGEVTVSRAPLDVYVAQPVRWLGADFASSLDLRFYSVRCACRRKVRNGSNAASQKNASIVDAGQSSSGEKEGEPACSARESCALTAPIKQLRLVFQLLRDPLFTSARIQDAQNEKLQAGAPAHLCRFGLCFAHDSFFSWTPVNPVPWCASALI